MADFIRNSGYFLSEVRVIFSLNRASSMLSVLSLTLIFFILLLAVTGWRTTAILVQALEEEAEISVYYPQDLSVNAIDALQGAITSVEGVQGVRLVKAEEAYQRMSQVLGPEAEILTNFETNPFEAYYEVSIDLARLSSILKAVEALPNVTYVRDNQTVLDKLSRIAGGITALGIAVVAAVGVSTFIITAHIIREGVHSHRDQINTLKLLGAPDWFVEAPFIWEGVMLTVLSSTFASGTFMFFMTRYGSLLRDTVQFFPAVDTAGIMSSTILGLLIASFLMGLSSSWFGLKMIKQN